MASFAFLSSIGMSGQLVAEIDCLLVLSHPVFFSLFLLFNFNKVFFQLSNFHLWLFLNFINKS